MPGMMFLIMFLLLIALVAAVPPLLRRFHVPQVVAIMLVGIVVGPNGLDVFWHVNNFLSSGFPTSQLYRIVDAMGLLGLVFLMTLAGMELKPKLLNSQRKGVALLSLFTFTLPSIAGFLVYRHFRPDDVIGQLLYASLFASHSIDVVFSAIREMNIVRTGFGIIIIAATVITDLSSLLILAVCVLLKRRSTPADISGSISVFDRIDPSTLGLAFFPLFLAAIAAYIIVMLWLIPRVVHALFKNIQPEDDASLTVFLMVVLIVVFIGEMIGVNVMVGAFIAGMALAHCRVVSKESGILHKKLEGLGYGLLVPFLFLSLGMKTDLRVIVSAWDTVEIVVFTIVGLAASKIISGWIALRLAGFASRKAFCGGLMTVPQLSVTLAAAAVAYELQIIDLNFLNAIVCLSIATTIPVLTLIKVVIDRWGIKFDDVVDQPVMPENTGSDEIL